MAASLPLFDGASCGKRRTAVRAVDALVHLLRSDAGYAVLCEIMAGADARWFGEFERGVRLADLDRRIEWQRAELDTLKAEFASGA